PDVSPEVSGVSNLAKPLITPRDRPMRARSDWMTTSFGEQWSQHGRPQNPPAPPVGCDRGDLKTVPKRFVPHVTPLRPREPSPWERHFATGETSKPAARRPEARERQRGRGNFRLIPPRWLVQSVVMTGRLVSINGNASKEFRKLPQPEGHLIRDFG